MSKKELPPFNVPIRVYGSDCFGEWSMMASAVPYRPGSKKSQLKRVYRWLDDKGNVICNVERWKAANEH